LGTVLIGWLFAGLQRADFTFLYSTPRMIVFLACRLYKARFLASIGPLTLHLVLLAMIWMTPWFRLVSSTSVGW
jgi:hypothetical protein